MRLRAVAPRHGVVCKQDQPVLPFKFEHSLANAENCAAVIHCRLLVHYIRPRWKEHFQKLRQRQAHVPWRHWQLRIKTGTRGSGCNRMLRAIFLQVFCFQLCVCTCHLSRASDPWLETEVSQSIHTCAHLALGSADALSR